MMSDRNMYLAALCVAAVLFFGSCIFGYTASLAEPHTGDALSSSFQEVITELDAGEPALLSWQIFFNNLKVCLILFMGGITFGALTLIILVSNGYVIGGIAEVMLRGYDVSLFAASIVPHGIFEIAALLMSSALGLQMAHALFSDALAMRNAGEVCVWYGTRFLCVVVPLLIVAALMEAFVTPIAAEMMLDWLVE